MRQEAAERKRRLSRTGRATRQSKRKIVEVARTRDEALEVSAKKLVKQLRAWIAVNPSHGVR